MTTDSQTDAVLVAHMRDCLDRIAEYTRGGRASFESSRLIQDAVLRNLQTLTESSQRLSAKIENLESDVPWRSLAGFRNVVVHAYLGVDLGLIWSVVERDLPTPASALARMAESLGNTGPA